VRVNAAGAGRLLLLGGEFSGRNSDGTGAESRFDRVNTGRSIRAVALLWPHHGAHVPAARATVTWLDPEQRPFEGRVEVPRPASGPRDTALALRAARLWQAQIIARALELNERDDYQRAEQFVQRSVAELAAYADGLPEREELLAPLAALADRVGRRWKTRGHKEAYAMARFSMRGKQDYRLAAPASYLDAMLEEEQ
jgi:hypothetical protein